MGGFIVLIGIYVADRTKNSISQNV
jgi:hypothetical protein